MKTQTPDASHANICRRVNSHIEECKLAPTRAQLAKWHAATQQEVLKGEPGARHALQLLEGVMEYGIEDMWCCQVNNDGKGLGPQIHHANKVAQRLGYRITMVHNVVAVFVMPMRPESPNAKGWKTQLRKDFARIAVQNRPTLIIPPKPKRTIVAPAPKAPPKLQPICHPVTQKPLQLVTDGKQALAVCGDETLATCDLSWML